MNKQHKILPLFAAVMALTILVQGCHTPPVQTVDSPKPVETADVEDEPVVQPPTVSPAADGRFTLRYDSKSTLNPITGVNRDNILLSSLMYESLFIVDNHLVTQPVLCKSWETADNLTFKFEIYPDILMNDGELLTANDVSYSIKQAALKGRYVARLSKVASVSSDGELTVTVVLKSKNHRLPSLLDIPIIKNGSADSRVPPGTGPFQLIENDGTPYLVRNPRYRDYQSIPLSLIYLMECNDDELTQLFDDGQLSLLWDDPSDSFEIRLNRLNEKRYYDTTTLQFIGFNAKSGVMSDPYVRRAVGCSIDRNYLVNEILSGQAIAAPLPLSPAFPYYNLDWEKRAYDPLTEMTVLLDSADMEDFNNDSFLEISNGNGTYRKFTVDFIVNSENIHKIRAANYIADTLMSFGVNTVVRELPWEAFMTALKSGDFDMYYGEIALGADFDFSPLMLPGALNYGGTANTLFAPYIEDFLAAESDEDIQYAVEALFYEILTKSPFVPVLYKKNVVYSPLGAIARADPGQSNVFCNLKDWTINMAMLT